MRIHIFDVEHGECSLIETPSGHNIMIGAGHNSATNWRPSDWLRQNNLRLHKYIINHLDEDHLSDLSNFEPDLRPAYVMCNFHVDPLVIYNQKQREGGVGNGLTTATNWVKNVYTGDRVVVDYGLEEKHFYHPYSKFQDTNNLSVVSFYTYNNIGIVFPGDMEKKGWEEFLNIPDFVMSLGKVNIFVASHHGREGGYSDKIFNFCKPEIVIISDKLIEHDTQDHNLYGQHASGVSFDGITRKVLTTRLDGKITIDIPTAGRATISMSKNHG